MIDEAYAEDSTFVCPLCCDVEGFHGEKTTCVSEAVLGAITTEVDEDFFEECKVKVFSRGPPSSLSQCNRGL